MMNLKNEEAKALSSFVYCASEIVKDRTLLWIEFDEGDSGEDNAGVTARLDWTLDASKCMEVTLASPLASVMEAAISTLTLAFCEFLDGDYGNAARNLAGVKHKLAPVKTDYVKKDSADENIEPIDPASTDYAEGW